MDRLECANCGQLITADGPCPKCGSAERMVLYNLLARPELLGNFSMSFIGTIRLWKYLPAAIQSHLAVMEAAESAKRIKGLCQQSINSMAELVEGVITDNIEEELESLLYIEATRDELREKLKGLDFSNWKKKKKLAESVLGWELNTLENSSTMNLLFKLRDQLGHGRSYRLTDRRYLKDKALRRIGAIEIVNEKYKEIYKDLENKGFVPPIEEHESMNMDMFLMPSVAKGFYSHGVAFLRSFFKNIRLRSGYNMSYEFEDSMKND